MNSGPNRPAGESGGRGRRRRRGRRGPGQHGPAQGQQQGQWQGGQQAQGGGQNRHNGGPGRPHRQKQRQQRSGPMNTKMPDAHLYSAPMDHSYRAALQGGNGNGNGRSFQQGRQFFQPDPEPLPNNGQPTPRIFAYIVDLFFPAKINETARNLNLYVDFVKSD